MSHTLEVHVAGSPAAKLTLALAAYTTPSSIHAARIAHDVGCPCEDNKNSMVACTCEIVTVTVYDEGELDTFLEERR